MNKDQDQQNPQQPTELNESDLQQAQGGLIGLLLPAVQKVREAAARTTSISDGTSNTIKQVTGDGSV